MSIAEICNREVVVVEAHASVLEAVKRMRQFHVGDVVVVEETAAGRRPVGILTDRDVVLEIIAMELDPATISVGDAMSPEVFTIREDEDAMDAVKQLRIRAIRRAPVVDRAGLLVGVLSVDDLIEVLAEQMSDLGHLIAREQRKEAELRQ